MTQRSSIGLLITNLGTPDAPTPSAVRRYLAEFLSDPRVVEMPRLLWLPILHGVILRIRPRRVAQAYAAIWEAEGSPLLSGTRSLAEGVERLLEGVAVEVGMRYGNPSLAEGLERLRGRGAERVLVLPLYPQYSATTTGTTFDAIAGVLRGWRRIPALRFVADYHDHPAWIGALADSLRGSLREEERLLLSFHGLPRRYVEAGDPYAEQCRRSATLLVQRLGLAEDRWQLAFQSRFGREPWLEPYTDRTLERWAREGTRSVAVACPGFPVDCLETLEEIAMQNRDLFLQAGGESYRYLPALNDTPGHVAALAEIVRQELAGWRPQ
ncbi:MAG TPA: ferrochelatase [Thiotrichales bacterium]|nr:ferrochelatase [Thiotrichales bacterium]